MAIKRGDVVSHSLAAEWGVGKVVEVSPTKAAILFCDGVTRKIACSHFNKLLPAAQSSFLPLPEDAPKVVVQKAAKTTPGEKKKGKP